MPGDEAVLLRRENPQSGMGEEAGTKLLFPMIVLLAVVMASRYGACIYVHEHLSQKKGGGRMINLLENFWCDEEAVGVVEIILILVVLISLVLIFKEQLDSHCSEHFQKEITNQSNSV